MKLLPEFVMKVDATETPVSAATLALLQKNLHQLRLTVSGTATAAMALCGVSLLANLVEPNMWARLTFTLALVLFLVLRRYEKKGLAASLAAVAPVPAELCAEMAAVAQVSEPASKYCAGVRAQGREFVRAEYEAVLEAARRFVAPAAGQQALYGKR